MTAAAIGLSNRASKGVEVLQTKLFKGNELMGAKQMTAFTEAQDKWARVWFGSLARFHHIEDPSTWKFDQDDVIAFLRANLAKGVPAWKRAMGRIEAIRASKGKMVPTVMSAREVSGRLKALHQQRGRSFLR